jgi:hypothetical protein
MSSVKMTSKFKGTCRVCKKTITVGQTILWNKTTRQVSHPTCLGTKRKYTKMPKVIDHPELYYKDKPFSGSYKNGRAK